MYEQEKSLGLPNEKMSHICTVIHPHLLFHNLKLPFTRAGCSCVQNLQSIAHTTTWRLNVRLWSIHQLFKSLPLCRRLLFIRTKTSDRRTVCSRLQLASSNKPLSDYCTSPKDTTHYNKSHIVWSFVGKQMFSINKYFALSCSIYSTKNHVLLLFLYLCYFNTSWLLHLVLMTHFFFFFFYCVYCSAPKLQGKFSERKPDFDPNRQSRTHIMQGPSRAQVSWEACGDEAIHFVTLFRASQTIWQMAALSNVTHFKRDSTAGNDGTLNVQIYVV